MILSYIHYILTFISNKKRPLPNRFISVRQQPYYLSLYYLPSLALPKASVAIIAAYNSSGVTSPARLCIVSPFYHDLKIGAFFKNIIKDTRIQFDPNLVNRFLTYSRILNPDSKLGTHQNLVGFY